ncbi:MAG TPA: hypothetical protein VIG33_16960 [Pseudobdellovibrionaceae bacterium]|jgi:hypothetical protein
MSKFLGFYLIVTVWASLGLASANCVSVIDDLKAMQKAHQSISASLIGNHESFASILEDYSNTLSASANLHQPVTKEAVTNMNESAKAFRVRGQNAQKLNVKLNTASDQVIAKAIECLKFRK